MINLQAIVDEKSALIRQFEQTTPTMSPAKLVRLVKANGVDLKSRDDKGRTFLHYAVEQAQLEVIELSLEKGADVNAADNLGMTPLLTAVKSSQAKKILPLLMRHSIDMSARSKNGQNVLHALIHSSVMSDMEHAEDLIKAFVKKGGSIHDRENALNYQAIHLATAFSKNNLVKLLLDHGANVNDAKAKLGKFPLYLAAERKNTEVMETLLKRGANVHLKNNEGRTALHRACEDVMARFNWNNVKLLLDAGANVIVEDDYGNTPLALVFRNFHENSIDAEKNKAGIKILLEALASKKVGMQRSHELKDERIVRRHLDLWEYYRQCVENKSKTHNDTNNNNNNNDYYNNNNNNNGARRKGPNYNRNQPRKTYDNLQPPWRKDSSGSQMTKSANRFALIRPTN